MSSSGISGCLKRGLPGAAWPAGVRERAGGCGDSEAHGVSDWGLRWRMRTGWCSGSKLIEAQTGVWMLEAFLGGMEWPCPGGWDSGGGSHHVVCPLPPLVSQPGAPAGRSWSWSRAGCHLLVTLTCLQVAGLKLRLSWHQFLDVMEKAFRYCCWQPRQLRIRELPVAAGKHMVPAAGNAGC